MTFPCFMFDNGKHEVSYEELSSSSITKEQISKDKGVQLPFRHVWHTYLDFVISLPEAASQ